MSRRELIQYVEKYKARIDEGIAEELVKRAEEAKEISPHLTPIIEAMTELSKGGKRVRGILVILGYELAGGEVNDEVVRAAVTMELFHLGLLIQDDWMDRDKFRRGVKTIHVRYEDKHLGGSVAVLAGDYTYGWVVEMLSGLNIASERTNKAMGVWGKYFSRVGYGQTLDMMVEQRGDSSKEEVMKVLALKSGEYSCVLPLQFGASLGDGPLGLMQELEKYGMELGLVFQLRDDWLAEYGDRSKTGKPMGNDSREGKRTLATMYGRERLEKEMARHVELGTKLAKGNKVMEGLVSWLATREN